MAARSTPWSSRRAARRSDTGSRPTRAAAGPRDPRGPAARRLGVRRARHRPAGPHDRARQRSVAARRGALRVRARGTAPCPLPVQGRAARHRGVQPVAGRAPLARALDGELLEPDEREGRGPQAVTPGGGNVVTLWSSPTLRRPSPTRPRDRGTSRTGSPSIDAVSVLPATVTLVRWRRVPVVVVRRAHRRERRAELLVALHLLERDVAARAIEQQRVSGERGVVVGRRPHVDAVAAAVPRAARPRSPCSRAASPSPRARGAARAGGHVDAPVRERLDLLLVTPARASSRSRASCRRAAARRRTPATRPTAATMRPPPGGPDVVLAVGVVGDGAIGAQRSLAALGRDRRPALHARVELAGVVAERGVGQPHLGSALEPQHMRARPSPRYGLVADERTVGLVGGR